MDLATEDLLADQRFQAALHGIELDDPTPGYGGAGNSAWQQAKRLERERRGR